MLVDSHCHLDQIDLAAFDGSLDKVIEQAKQQSVDYLLCVCIDLANFPQVLAIAHRYPHISASFGIHPNEIMEQEPSMEMLLEKAAQPKVVAIGETGLDYYRSEGDITWQQERFRRHIRLARELKKPLIVHTREASEDTLRILHEERAHEIGGVLHCFTETLEVARKAIDMNFLISFSGIITFKNATALQAVVKQIPLDRMLIETDAPYLAPLPYRGKQNQPAYVYYVAQAVAALRETEMETIARITTANFFSLFEGAQR